MERKPDKPLAFNQQAVLKAEMIAHMVMAQLTPYKIAQAMGMTLYGLKQIMIRPEYQEIEDRVAGRAQKKVEEASDRNLERRMALKVEVEDAVSEAVGLLLKTLREKNDLRAALEILDREPQHQFSKASRSQTEAKAPSTISSAALADAVREADITSKIMRSAENLEPDQTFPKA